MSGTIDKLKAKVDNVLHKDKTSDPTGPHDSHAANKADPRVDSDRIGGAGNTTGAGGYGTTTTGTHGTTGAHGITGTHGTTGTHGITGTHGTAGAHGITGTHGHTNTTGTYGSDPTGPHDSHLANKADPRVDSDHVGGIGNTTSAGGYGTGSHTTGGYGAGTHTGGVTGTTGTHGSDPTGPHDSRLANQLDPRVDSDRVGPAGNTSGAGGYGTATTGTHGTAGGYGTTGTHGITGTHGNIGTTGTHGSDPTGPHDSRLANKGDPRVDSDRVGPAGNTVGTGGYGTGQHSTTTGTHAHHGQHAVQANVGSGNSNTTAGPHNSDLLNKLDPRVDSDLDGSKTVGGNATHR